MEHYNYMALPGFYLINCLLNLPVKMQKRIIKIKEIFEFCKHPMLVFGFQFAY